MNAKGKEKVKKEQPIEDKEDRNREDREVREDRKREGKGTVGGALTDRKAWTMSALMELRGLSRITTKICSSFSRLMKFPNQDFLANL